MKSHASDQAVFDHLAILAKNRPDLFRHLDALDVTGHVQASVSREATYDDIDSSHANDNHFLVPTSTNESYFGPVTFDESTCEPSMIIAVPNVDPRNGTAQGVIVATVDFKQIWNLIARLPRIPQEVSTCWTVGDASQPTTTTPLFSGVQSLISRQFPGYRGI